jgi:hypothetical protein
MNKYMPQKKGFFLGGGGGGGYLIKGEEEEEKPQTQALLCFVYVHLVHKMSFHDKCYRSISSPYLVHIPL